MLDSHQIVLFLNKFFFAAAHRKHHAADEKRGNEIEQKDNILSYSLKINFKHVEEFFSVKKKGNLMYGLSKSNDFRRKYSFCDKRFHFSFFIIFNLIHPRCNLRASTSYKSTINNLITIYNCENENQPKIYYYKLNDEKMSVFKMIRKLKAGEKKTNKKKIDSRDESAIDAG